MDIKTNTSVSINNGNVNANSDASITNLQTQQPPIPQAQQNPTTDSAAQQIAYQTAINAYQFHITRYNTWMNYYAIFTGAMFVGLYTTMTNCVTETQTTIQFAISAIGLVAAICWWMSLTGYYAWLKSWTSIVKKYEKQYFGVDASSENPSIYNSIETQNNKTDDAKYLPKFISTQKVTSFFIQTIVLGWMFVIMHIANLFTCGWWILLPLAIHTILFCMINYCSCKMYSSDISDMIK